MSIQFSVIIPVYNRADTISRAVDSVLKQSYPAYEIIVVNDGSDDHTPDMLSQYQGKIRIINQLNQGVSAARNYGIASAAGDWIALLDSDDEWLPHKLAIQADYILNNPEIRILQTDEIWIRNGKRVNPMKKHQKKDGYIFSESLPLCIVSPSAVVFQRSLYDEYGPFNVLLPVCEDYELWLKIAAQEPVGFIREFGIRKYGGHDDQLSRKYWGMDRFRIQALENVLSHAKLNDEQIREVRQEIVRKATILQIGAKKRGQDDSQWQIIIDQYETE